MRRLSFFFIFTIFFYACDINREKGNLSFDLDSFKQQIVNRNEAEILAPDSLLLGRPGIFRLHPDGFLVIMDLSAKDQVSIVDLRDRSVQGFIKRGRGPMELIVAWNVEIDGSDVWVSGPQDSKMVRLALNRNTRKFDAVEDLKLSETRFMNALPFNNSEFLIICNPSSENRMEIVSDKGESIRKVGSFPDVAVPSGYHINNAWLESVVTISLDKKYTAVSCKNIDYIDIYDRNMELKKRLRGPIGAEPEFLVRKLSAGTQFIQKPRFDVFDTAASNDDMFLLGYKGLELKSEEDLRLEAYQILSFDWNGKPLKCYTFEHPIWCFDVDAKGRKLYVATRNNESLEPEILIYDI